MNTPVKTLGEDAITRAGMATQQAEPAIRLSAQELNHTAEGVDEARSQAGTRLGQLGPLASDTESLAHRGIDALLEGASQLRDRSLYMKDATTAYIQHAPVRSMLMAAAAGAALMGLVAQIKRHRDSPR